MSEVKLAEIGEKKLISVLTAAILSDARLHGGFGHDSGILDVSVADDEYLLVNTDRSGVNVAYTLGLASGECIGDFAVSHAVSDIFASGGVPLAVTIALLLPPETSVSLAKEIMVGADLAARKYGAFIAAGDTKRNSKLSAVVTAIGKCRKDYALTRSGAQDGDLIVLTGALGTMIAGFIAYKNGFRLSEQEKKVFNEALIFQNPPYRLARDISSSRLAHACTDNSDGLSSSVHSLCASSGLGAVVYEDRIPMRKESIVIASKMGVPPIQLSLASGDWEFLYAVPESDIDIFMETASWYSAEACVIGRFTKKRKVIISDDNGDFEFLKIENDRFMEGRSTFDCLSNTISYKGERADL